MLAGRPAYPGRDGKSRVESWRLRTGPCAAPSAEALWPDERTLAVQFESACGLWAYEFRDKIAKGTAPHHRLEDTRLNFLLLTEFAFAPSEPACALQRPRA